MKESFALMADMEKLELVGLTVTVQPSMLDGENEEVMALIEEERAWCGNMMKVLLGWARARTDSMSYYTHGFPGCFSKMFGGARQMGLLLLWMEIAHEAYMTCRSSSFSTKRFWRLLLERSFFRWPRVRLYFAAGRSGGGERFTKMQAAMADDDIYGLCGTKTIEDAFHYEKSTVEVESANGHISRTTRWAVPVQERILTELHRYKEVRAEEDLAVAGECTETKIPDHVWQARRKEVSNERLLEFSSGLENPAWPRFSAQTLSKMVSDVFLMIEYTKKDLWKNENAAFYITFLMPGLLIKNVEDNRLYFVAGRMHYVSVCFPARTLVLPSGKYMYEVSDDYDYATFVVCTDLSEWRCIPYDWGGPLATAYYEGSATAGDRVAAIPFGDEEDLVTTAARNCFWHLSDQSLDMLLADRKLEKQKTIF